MGGLCRSVRLSRKKLKWSRFHLVVLELSTHPFYYQAYKLVLEKMVAWKPLVPATLASLSNVVHAGTCKCVSKA